MGLSVHLGASPGVRCRPWLAASLVPSTPAKSPKSGHQPLVFYATPRSRAITWAALAVVVVLIVVGVLAPYIMPVPTNILVATNQSIVGRIAIVEGALFKTWMSGRKVIRARCLATQRAHGRGHITRGANLLDTTKYTWLRRVQHTCWGGRGSREGSYQDHRQGQQGTSELHWISFLKSIHSRNSLRALLRPTLLRLSARRQPSAGAAWLAAVLLDNASTFSILTKPIL